MQKLNQFAVYVQLNKLDEIPQLKIFEEKTTLKPSILAIIAAATLTLFSLIINISSIVIGIGCVIIPGYFTFEVIGTKIERQYIKYLVYWVSYGVIEVLFVPAISFVFGYTFLMIVQIVVAVALLHPNFNFALILYDRVIRVYVLKQEAKSNHSLKIQKQPSGQFNLQTHHHKVQQTTPVSVTPSNEPELSRSD